MLTTCMRTCRRDDRGDIVLGWLTKTVVTLAIFGVMVFDALAIFAGRMSTSDAANEAAMAASDAWHSRPDIQSAYDAAESVAVAHNGTIPTATFRIDDKGAVHLQLRRQLTTLVAHRIGPLEKYTWAIESGEADPSP